jgi:hypothetical protein
MCKERVSGSKIFLVVVLILFTSVCYPQAEPGDDPDVPIDGGISILLAAGVGYGVIALRKKKDESE